MTMPRPLLTLTDRAVVRVSALLAARGRPAAGIRVDVRPRGCSGLTYALEYADEAPKGDAVVTSGGVKVFVTPRAEVYLAGAEIDYAENGLEGGFVFKNPNEKSRCGCGESFSA